MFTHSGWPQAGGLISYGPNFSAYYRRAAELVAQIFKGANPADIPVERPGAVELVINVTTAKALGIAFPESIRARADRILE
jgi:putative ABC transport system substrate-binding protein